MYDLRYLIKGKRKGREKMEGREKMTTSRTIGRLPNSICLKNERFGICIH